MPTMPPIPPITKILLLTCTGMFCALMLLQNVLPWFFNGLALWPLGSGQFWPWQLLSYAFLHSSMGHLFFNMLGLWMFGGQMEQVWGAKRYTHFMLASTLTAALSQLALCLVLGSMAPTVGVSGALFGLLLAYGVLFPNRIIMPIFPPIPMKAKYFVMIFGAFTLVMGLMDGGAGGTAHFAHLGGMIGGYLMILFWRGQLPFLGGTGRRRR